MSTRLKIFIFSIVLLIIPIHLFSKGIIIADDIRVVNLFRDSDSVEISLFAHYLASQYNKIILHLGRDYNFEKGGMFFTKKSKQNLRIFSKVLYEQKRHLYLWFLDSYGAQQFENIYANYREVVDYQYQKLKDHDIVYQGVIIDLEWINLPNEDNNQKLYEILRYLKQVFKEKQIGLFAPLIDNPDENLIRGYNHDSLKSIVDIPIAMVYPKDAGLYLDSKHIKPYLSDRRYKDLKRFFRSSQISVAVSLESGFYLMRNNQFYFIKTCCSIPENIASSLELIYEFKQTILTLKVYQPMNPVQIIRNDGINESVLPSERLIFIHINSSIVQQDDYIWEYFLMC